MLQFQSRPHRLRHSNKKLNWSMTKKKDPQFSSTRRKRRKEGITELSKHFYEQVKKTSSSERYRNIVENPICMTEKRFVM